MVMNLLLYYTPVSNSDYVGLSKIIKFYSCEVRKCVNVTIVDDAISEPRGIHLRRTSDHGRSTLVDGMIEICDDDGQYSMYK